MRLLALPAVLVMLMAPALPAGEAPPAPNRAGPSSIESGRAPTVAHDARPPLPETRARRRALVELLRPMLAGESPGAFYLKGGVDDYTNEFRQNSTFYYLAGLDTPFASMVIFFDRESAVERLYVPAVEDRWERYVGDALEPGTVSRETGMPDAERAGAISFSGFRGAGEGDAAAVRESTRIREDLLEVLGRKGTLFLAELQTVDGRPDLDPDSVPGKIRRKRKRTRFQSASFALRQLRLVKTDDEVARIREATEITCEAHREALATMRPGIPEYMVEGAIEAAFIRGGARYSAFPSIVGSGPNSTVLHYYLNGRTMESDEVVVIDIGAEYARYASDITRTLPTSGRFTPDQREIYDAVMEAQLAGIALAKPGSSITKINEGVKEVLRGHGMEEAFWHGCCHFVGLDVHDVGSGDVVLKAGMVLTVEPGVYLPEKGIGIRIEDTLLITGEGNEVLSDCAPKGAAEIEASMSAGGVSRGVPASRPR